MSEDASRQEGTRGHAPEAVQQPPRLFTACPRDGVWTTVGLTRAQFFGILVASTLVFLLWGGPLWAPDRGGDFPRLVASYLFIPLAVAGALARNRKLRLALFLGATGVLAIAKLVVTAGLDVALGIALGTR
jgi:hypothetical protein